MHAREIPSVGLVDPKPHVKEFIQVWCAQADPDVQSSKKKLFIQVCATLPMNSFFGLEVAYLSSARCIP